MAKILLHLILVVAALITATRSACYIDTSGCNAPEGEIGYWPHPELPCIRCSCFERMMHAKTCVYKSTSAGVKKSAVKSTHALEMDEVVMEKEEIDNLQCVDVESLKLSPQMGLLEEGSQNVLLVAYYYMTSTAECCSTHMTYSSIPPSCELKKIDECSSDLVSKANPNLPCYQPFYMVG